MSFDRDNRWESIPKLFKNRATRTGVLAECVSGRKISVRDSVYGAGQARGQKCSHLIEYTARTPLDQSHETHDSLIDSLKSHFRKERKSIYVSK